jgi:Putative Flp pilus-assembly TadE/G-like
MRAVRPACHSDRGQMIVLLALVLTVSLLLVGLVIDGGTALAQRRASQNASDFAALAGARVVAEWIGGDSANGTDANVRAAIANAIGSNGGATIAFGAPNGPRYVDAQGRLLGLVGSGAIPATAVGVTVSSSRTWTPYFLGIAGFTSWSASASATAKGGFADGPGGTLFPVGIAENFFKTYPFCSGPISSIPGDPCYPQHLTPGNLNVPGGFGWLKFGCDGYGLGQVPPANAGGCGDSIPFLQGEIGPPAKSYGCCTKVGLPGSLDRIGNLPGNKVAADCSYFIDNGITVTVPVWDTAGGSGQNAWYHIIGYAGFQLTGCTGGKDIEGVYRKPFFTGQTTSTPGFPGAALGVELIH